MTMEIAATVPAPSGLFARFDRMLGATIEAAAALLVVAEAALLGWATTARYLFSQPLAWSDELAAVLFVWLSMLGAVVALRRGEHMRLTTFVRNMSPAWRARADALALCWFARCWRPSCRPASSTCRTTWPARRRFWKSARPGGNRRCWSAWC